MILSKPLRIQSEYDVLFEFLAYGLIRNSQLCICNAQPMTPLFNTKTKYKLGLYWKCSKCNRERSITFESVFHSNKIGFKSYKALLRQWCRSFHVRETTITINEFIETIDNSSVYKYNQFFREVASNFIAAYLPIINLPGPIHEIDEMDLGAKRKGGRGRYPVRAKIVFGIYCRSSKKVILYHIDNRERDTLLPLILTNIAVGSVIISDQFASYYNTRSNRSHLEAHGYQHYVVNHSERFVDPYLDFVHTNNIERTWRSLRSSISLVKRSLSNEVIDSYLNTFILKSMIDEDGLYEFMLNVLRFMLYEH